MEECTCPPSKICDLCSPLLRVASLPVTEAEEREAEAERQAEAEKKERDKLKREEAKRF